MGHAEVAERWRRKEVVGRWKREGSEGRERQLGKEGEEGRARERRERRSGGKEKLKRDSMRASSGSDRRWERGMLRVEERWERREEEKVEMEWRPAAALRGVVEVVAVVDARAERRRRPAEKEGGMWRSTSTIVVGWNLEVCIVWRGGWLYI